MLGAGFGVGVSFINELGAMLKNWRIYMTENKVAFIFRHGNTYKRWDDLDYLLQVNDSTLTDIRNHILTSNSWIKEASLKKSIPSRDIPKKEDYILEWIKVFDDGLTYETCMLEEFIKRYSKYSFEQLELAFKWAYTNYFELELGCGTAWGGSTMTILKLLKQKQWNNQSETRLIKEYLVDTSWFDITAFERHVEQTKQATTVQELIDDLFDKGEYELAIKILARQLPFEQVKKFCVSYEQFMKSAKGYLDWVNSIEQEGWRKWLLTEFEDYGNLKKAVEEFPLNKTN